MNEGDVIRAAGLVGRVTRVTLRASSCTLEVSGEEFDSPDFIVIDREAAVEVRYA